ncbi:hypothetical protein [Thermomonospora cellulosilytica]|uniref:Uncharacterized protein n=1 Tax=Thermomonospora cellulosilytica TaxID=1411118 RepID=A0A7W3MV85_9ACTN|nr:hypothetical protein [Thermomonospora cellulosilytica]MBA9002529.1 hypothetical protein [Thermomonospora cellulosilytica]
MAAFAARLREFHEACGAPAYRSLAAVSRRLTELYPDQAERDLPTLSVSAISAVLSGRRANPPSAGWVAAFVLSCQRRAFETMALATDPGPAVIPEWMRILQEARAAARARPGAGGGTPLHR